MKTRFAAISLFLTFVSAAALPAAAAEPAPAQKIGLVNVTRIFKEYDGVKASESEMEKLSTAKQQEREKRVAQIRDMRDELALLNDEARDQKRESIEEQLRQLANFDQQAKEAILEKREEALGKILDMIEKVVTAHAKQKGYDLILNDRAVIYRADAVDITDEVLAIMNQEYAGKKP